MNNRDYFSVNEEAFENLLHSSVPSEPPEEIVDAVTPWKKAIKRVLWGLAFNTLTLNFFYLNYILPVIGTVLSLLGLRVLRRENKYFRAYYCVAVIGTAYKWFVFALGTTVTFDEIIPETLLTILSLFFIYAQLILFCLSLYTSAKKAEVTPEKRPMVALIIWFIILTGLGLMNYTGFIIPIAMIIGFVFIIKSLNKISSEIDEVGYSIENAPVRLSDSLLSAMLIAALLVSLGCGYAFFSGHKMNWEVKEADEHIEVQEIKDHLINLGFPEKILDDLSADDILKCKGAQKVVVDTRQVPFNDDGHQVTYQKQITPYFSSTVTETVYLVREMSMTGVGVCLRGEPEEDGDWMRIHHFSWDVNPGFYGTECIQIWPAYRNWHTNSFRYVDAPTGRVLYTKNGIDYVSPYHSLGEENYTTDDIFGVRSNRDIFATFSFSGKGENHRGYVMYPVEDNKEGHSIIDSWMKYNHQQSLLQYPAETATEYIKSGILRDSIAFREQQCALQIAEYELM